MKLSFSLAGLLLLCPFVKAQTTVFSDNFSASNSATYSTATLPGGWTINRNAADWGARRNGNLLELTNDASGSANANGYAFVSQSTSGFASPYTVQLNQNAGVVTWTFNIAQERTDPGGVSTNNGYAAAFVLASNGSNPYFNLAADGYAVTFGQSGSTDPLRLFYFTNGMNNATNLITAGVSPFNDLSTQYLSVKITYSPCTNQWEMFARNDGASFADPLTGTLTSLGTATNSTYTGTSLGFMGPYWQGSTSAAQNAVFDNITVSVGAGTPGLWRGTASTDWFNCANWDDKEVPVATTNVTINQSASNNCVIGGTGTAVCNNITLSSNSGTNRTLTVQGTATLNCGGNVAVTKTAGSGDLKLTLLNSAIFRCNDFTLTGTASGAENAQFENKLSTSTATVNGNVTINAGGVLDLTDAADYGTLHLRGNYINNGLETDLKQSNSIIYFDGTGAQTISANGFSEVFANLVINKTSGNVTLLCPVQIENSVTYTNGVLVSSAADLLIFNDGATTSGMSNASFTDGPVRKTGDDPFTFPVGAGANYQPATISAPSSATDHFTVQYFHSDPGASYDPNSRDASLDHVSGCEYWIIDRTGGASDVDVTLSWNAGSCGVTNPAALRVARWDGTQWKDQGNGGTTGTAAAGTVITSAAVTSFSPFTLSSITTENPLPVELIAFTAECESGVKQIRWSTASEQNNAWFTLERSVDAVNYETVSVIAGAGNSNTVHEYSYTDADKSGDVWYYRLIQSDYDGAKEIFGPVSVTCKTSEHTQGGLRLHSVQSSGVSFSLTGADGEPVQICVTDALGKIVWTGKQQVADGQLLQVPAAGWAPGFYTILVTGGTAWQPLKFILP